MKIKNTSPTAEKVSHAEVADALGAEQIKQRIFLPPNPIIHVKFIGKERILKRLQLTLSE